MVQDPYLAISKISQVIRYSTYIASYRSSNGCVVLFVNREWRCGQFDIFLANFERSELHLSTCDRRKHRIVWHTVYCLSNWLASELLRPKRVPNWVFCFSFWLVTVFCVHDSCSSYRFPIHHIPFFYSMFFNLEAVKIEMPLRSTWRKNLQSLSEFIRKYMEKNICDYNY